MLHCASRDRSARKSLWCEAIIGARPDSPVSSYEGGSVGTNFADCLLEAIREKNAPACVGLDPLLGRLPRDLLEEFGRPDQSSDSGHDHEYIGRAAQAILAYGREIIRIIAPHVPAIKINIAFFEPYYEEGMRAYFQMVRHARDAGLVVIGDIKRADIGHSTTQYAAAHLGGVEPADEDGFALPDAVTVNPYFGYDAIRPFVEVARERGRGLFVLVQTSNESAAEVQGVMLSDQTTLCHHVADLVQTWAQDKGLIGESGYSCIGAVVSPRDVDLSRELRSQMPNCIFLVPGFGAQGRTAEEVSTCFNADGTGAIVSASRSVIYAYENVRYQGTCPDGWQSCVAKAAEDLVNSVRSVLAVT